MSNEIPEIKHIVMDASDSFMVSAIGISAVDYTCPSCGKDFKAGGYIRVHQWDEEDRHCVCEECDTKSYCTGKCQKCQYMADAINETKKHLKEGTIPSEPSKKSFIDEVMGNE